MRDDDEDDEDDALNLARSLDPVTSKMFVNELLAKLDTVKGHRRKVENAVLVVAGNLLYNWQHGESGTTRYSRDHSGITVSSRYNPRGVSTRKIESIMDALRDNGYIHHKMGFYSKPKKEGKQSRAKPKKPLLDLALKHDLLVDSTLIDKSSEIIRLKNAEKQLIEYEDDEITSAMRNDLADWNNFMEQYDVDLWLSNAEIKADERLSKTDFAKTQLYRVFNRSSFSEGGRFYGHWLQQVESKHRILTQLNQKDTVEVDWSSLHPAMLYALDGLPIPVEDLYFLPGITLERGVIKEIMLIILNTESQTGAVAAINKNLKGKLTLSDGSSIKAKTILDALKRKHRYISKHFYTGVARRLQFLDSEMIRHIMKGFIREHVPMVPIHDSIITWRSCEHIAQKLMREAVETMLLQKGIGQLNTIKDDELGWIDRYIGPSLRAVPEHERREMTIGDPTDLLGEKGDRFFEVSRDIEARQNRRKKVRS